MSLVLDKAIAYDTVDSPEFNNSLTRATDQLQSAEKSERAQYELGSVVVFGASISFTAGALVWVFRGGALLGTVLASQPLWSSVNPLNAATVKRDSKGQIKSESTVEKIFE